MEVAMPKVTPGDYSEEQGEFLRAVGDFRTRTGRHVLRVTDYLSVLRDMGYRRRSKILTVVESEDRSKV